VKEETAILAAGAVLLALISCCVVSFIVYTLIPSPETAQKPPEGNTTTPGMNTTNGTTNATQPTISAQDLAVWTKITKINVEALCLQKAKEQAGSNPNLVYSCGCSEVLEDTVKKYHCLIETADPFTTYFANIDCYLDQKECRIETNYGAQNVTFSQLGELG
jgi:hypothetical protein